ncbi:hypothetical protein FNH22_01045 [Fulvivirga sp. M361]|uniref:hypothetical protein n=1 Tax=Fulvivirga sp. M361 TaxID=2594266 RepID=UPI00117A3FF2|nr:hypothetical protein [Fulvivirga sp. M361]TRX62713.1 hypothetical protein FNH22_01045 [Fulvivirga sp. M361]
MEKVLTILLFVLLCSVAYAQMGIGIQTPYASAELEVVSSDKGILIPRLTSQDLVSNPAEGLLIYNTTEGKFYCYDGSEWQELSPWDYRQGSTAADEEDLVVNFTNATTNAGIASFNPQSKLSIGGNAAIGSSYTGSNAAPSDGLLVEGNVGLGTTNPGTHKLDVNGTSDFTGDMTITGEVAEGVQFLLVLS